MKKKSMMNSLFPLKAIVLLQNLQIEVSTQKSLGYVLSFAMSVTL